MTVEPAVGFEPTTDGLQNRCSTTELNWRPRNKAMVGAVRFELTTSCTPSKRAYQTTLRPDRFAPSSVSRTEAVQNIVEAAA